MVYGEDFAQLTQAGQTRAPGAIGSQHSAEGQFGGAIAPPRPVTSIPNLIALAAETQKCAADRTISVDGLATRALDIAARLAGSFPTPAPTRDSSVRGERNDPSSALDALHRTIVDIRLPVVAMDDPLNRLACALDAIDSALR